MPFANKNRAPPPLTGTVACRPVTLLPVAPPPRPAFFLHVLPPCSSLDAAASAALLPARLRGRAQVSRSRSPARRLPPRTIQTEGREQTRSKGWGKQGGEASSGEVERSEASAGFYGVGVVLAIDGNSSAGVVVGTRSHRELDATARRRKRRRWSSPPYAQVVQGLAQGARGQHPTRQHPVSAFAPPFSLQPPRFHSCSSCRLHTAPCRLRNGSARFLAQTGAE
jgi:hypothetical protein